MLHFNDPSRRIENELMTPSMKLKRPQLVKRFQPQIDAMYKELKAAHARRAA